MKFEIRNSKIEANSKTEARLESAGSGEATGSFPLTPALSLGERGTSDAAFTLIELLVVIAIIGILAAIAMPTIGMFKPNPLAAASRQLLDDLAFARHKALADHTTVYVVFVPSTANLNLNTLGLMNPNIQQRMSKGQYAAYALYERRQIGDQPGQKRPHWLTNWRLLPKGTYIATQKFGRNVVAPAQERLTAAFGNNYAGFDFMTFDYGSADTNADNGPFFTDPDNPTLTYSKSYSQMPFIAFDYRGSLVPPWNGWRGPNTADGKGAITNNAADCVIPLTQGYSGGTTSWPTPAVPNENPKNGWTNMPGYNLVVIDGPTGRARIERVQLQ